MAWEIERKFLVDTRQWRPRSPGVAYQQGYVSDENGGCVRVRIAGDEALLTIKGPTSGTRRLEFEYTIPIDDARMMLNQLCGGRIVEKTRYREVHDGGAWEIDIFHGDNTGLVMAEIELPEIGVEFTLPAWASREVSDEFRYANSNLATCPYKLWRLALA
jgi:CYTH domain-containing protein